MAANSNHPLRIHVLLLLLATVSPLISLVAADCYWPDGSNAFDMQECYGPKGADGLCCAPGDSCLVNHLCRDAIDRSLYRGACNMPNWTQGMTCPKFCTSRENENNMAGIQTVDECWKPDGFYVCHKGEPGGNTCFNPFNPLLKLSGCDEEYNIAGNRTVVAEMPSCPYGVDDPSPRTTGPTSTFTDRFVQPAISNSMIRPTPLMSK